MKRCSAGWLMTGVAIAMAAGIVGWVVAAARRRMAAEDQGDTVPTTPEAELRPIA